MAPKKPAEPKEESPKDITTLTIDGTEYRIREVSGYELTRAMKRPVKSGAGEEDALVELIALCVEPEMTREEIKTLPAKTWFELTATITRIHGLDFH